MPTIASVAEAAACSIGAVQYPMDDRENPSIGAIQASQPIRDIARSQATSQSRLDHQPSLARFEAYFGTKEPFGASIFRPPSYSLTLTPSNLHLWTSKSSPLFSNVSSSAVDPPRTSVVAIPNPPKLQAIH